MTWLKGLTTPRGTRTDLDVDAGRIRGRGRAPEAAETEDWTGYLLLPRFTDAHVHLDKTFYGCPPEDHRVPSVDLSTYVDAEHRIRPTLPLSTARRAAALLTELIAKGTGHVRTHADVDTEWGLSNVEALLEVRRAFESIVHMQIVAFPQRGILRDPGTADLLRECARLGVNAIGGLDPSAVDGDPHGHLDRVFSLAAEHGIGADIHLHEAGSGGIAQIGLICTFAEEFGLGGRVSISHAYALRHADAAEVDEIAERLVSAGVALITSVPPQGAPPLSQLLARGVAVGLGSDNIRDVFTPFGDGDMLRRTVQAASHEWASTDEDLQRWTELGTIGGARACSFAPSALNTGDDADFVLIPATGLRDAMSRIPSERVVFSRGEIVADTRHAGATS